MQSSFVVIFVDSTKLIARDSLLRTEVYQWWVSIGQFINTWIIVLPWVWLACCSQLKDAYTATYCAGMSSQSLPTYISTYTRLLESTHCHTLPTLCPQPLQPPQPCSSLLQPPWILSHPLPVNIIPYAMQQYMLCLHQTPLTGPRIMSPSDLQSWIQPCVPNPHPGPPLLLPPAPHHTYLLNR